MKKILFFIFAVTFSFSSIAQDGKFGISFGFNNLSINSTINGVDADESFAGFYGGIWGEYKLSEKFSVRPEGQMTFKTKGGLNFKEYMALVALKYNLTDKFNIQAGPQVDYDLGINKGGNALGVGALLGIGYNISSRLDLSARYSIPFTNRITDGSGESKYSILQIGLNIQIFR